LDESRASPVRSPLPERCAQPRRLLSCPAGTTAFLAANAERLASSRLITIMPRYYFNIWNGAALIKDREGMELDNAADARFEARQSAREMLSAQLLAGEEVDGRRIEIVDAKGTPVETLPLRDVLLKEE
jgi:hypothetical protein